MSREGYELIDTIILNGVIGYCDTDDENRETIGVKRIEKVKRLNGEVKETVVDSFCFQGRNEVQLWENVFVNWK